MQVFVPCDTFGECASVLDYKRLGKQRVECLQILKALTLDDYGWKNHPATKMWANNIKGLAAYAISICAEWIKRGYKDTCLDKILEIVPEPDWNDLPTWWGDERVHSSHRSNLLRKDSDFYSKYEWVDDPAVEYYWVV